MNPFRRNKEPEAVLVDRINANLKVVSDDMNTLRNRGASIKLKYWNSLRNSQIIYDPRDLTIIATRTTTEEFR